jgi:hypothetical protein
MICQMCALAADYGRQDVHVLCTNCDCHHEPIQGEPRLVGELAPVEEVMARSTGFGPGGYRARMCEHCGKTVALNKNGAMRRHPPGTVKKCPGSGIIHD